MQDLAYFEDRAPGRGRLSPVRSWLPSNAPAIALDGTWRMRLHATATPATDASTPPWDPELDTSAWETIAVPSHWVLTGDGERGRPWYTNVVYPFPVDPPFTPHENPTADHARTFDLPETGEWAEAQRLV